MLEAGVEAVIGRAGDRGGSDDVANLVGEVGLRGPVWVARIWVMRRPEMLRRWTAG